MSDLHVTMYNQENQGDKRIDEQLALSVPCDNTLKGRLYIKPTNLSYSSYSDECFDTNKQSSDNSDQNLNETSTVSLLRFYIRRQNNFKIS